LEPAGSDEGLAATSVEKPGGAATSQRRDTGRRGISEAVGRHEISKAAGRRGISEAAGRHGISEAAGRRGISEAAGRRGISWVPPATEGAGRACSCQRCLEVRGGRRVEVGGGRRVEVGGGRRLEVGGGREVQGVRLRVWRVGVG
jgi:hypothetical protein